MWGHCYVMMRFRLRVPAFRQPESYRCTAVAISKAGRAAVVLHIHCVLPTFCQMFLEPYQFTPFVYCLPSTSGIVLWRPNEKEAVRHLVNLQALVSEEPGAQWNS